MVRRMHVGMGRFYTGIHRRGACAPKKIRKEQKHERMAKFAATVLINRINGLDNVLVFYNRHRSHGQAEKAEKNIRENDDWAKHNECRRSTVAGTRKDGQID